MYKHYSLGDIVSLAERNGQEPAITHKECAEILEYELMKRYQAAEGLAHGIFPTLRKESVIEGEFSYRNYCRKLIESEDVFQAVQDNLLGYVRSNSVEYQMVG